MLPTRSLSPALTLLLVSLFHQRAKAQDQAPTPTNNPSGFFPSATETPPYSQSGYNGSFNYYFVIIAVVILIIIFTYLVLLRRRRRILNQRRARGENVDDIEGRRWVGSRWIPIGISETRREEGLNERGEAPPPYLPGQGPPPPIGAEPGIALQDLAGKPPDYDAHSTDEDVDIMRPSPTYRPDHPRATAAASTDRADGPIQNPPPGPSSQHEVSENPWAGSTSAQGGSQTVSDEMHQSIPPTHSPRP